MRIVKRQNVQMPKIDGLLSLTFRPIIDNPKDEIWISMADLDYF